MTQKQIEAARKALNEKHYGDGPYVKENEIVRWYKKDKILRKELSCREMINSILIYDGADSCKPGAHSYEEYLKPYAAKSKWHAGLISEERLSELIAEQTEDVAKAKVGWCEQPDSEGGYYKYCRFADEEA